MTEEGFAFAFALLVGCLHEICAVGLDWIKWTYVQSEDCETCPIVPAAVALVTVVIFPMLLIVFAVRGALSLVSCIAFVSGESFDMAVFVPENLGSIIMSDGSFANIITHTLVTIVIVLIIAIFRIVF